MRNKNEVTDEMMAQARSWYVRLADEQADASKWEAFTLWLEESPLHVDAYDQVELVLADITTPQADAEEKNNIVAFSPKRRLMSSYIQFGSIAALLIAALTLFATTDVLRTKTVRTQIYATNIGGQKDIVLEDGTHISLNTNSQISVTMRKKSRTVTLKNGEAYFDIAYDEKRPFTVLAQNTIITDIGTAFSVYTSDKALTVSVVQGIVDMNSGEQVVRLTKGKQAIQMHGQSAIAIAPIDVENISTWRDGVLVFEDTALSRIVPELNRYFQTPIVLSDKKVSEITFSGVLNISDQDTLLSSIEALMTVKMEMQKGQIILSSEN